MGDSDDDAKSTLGYCFTLGLRNFSLSCSETDIVAQFTIEAEFGTAAGEINKTLWLKKILVEFHIEPTESIKVFVENEATTTICHNLVFHGRTKNIKIKSLFMEI